MKKRKSHLWQLINDAAFVAGITIVNKCLEKKESPLVQRDLDVESLNKRLTVVSLVYHAIGVFYNE